MDLTKVMDEETGLEDILEQSNNNFFESGNVPTLLIDSDTIVYRTAAVTDGRQYTIGKTAFKYKSDAMKYIKDNDLDVADLSEEYHPEPVKNVMKILNISIGKIIGYGHSRFDRFNMEFFHSSKENWRKEILPTYKESRVGKRKPHHLGTCRDSITQRFYEVNKTGYEADDLIGIRAYELRKKGIPYVIVSNDKDLKTIPGDHYDWTTEEEFTSSETEAMKFFYAQTIAGDNTDDIPGVSGLGINNKGTGKAQKIIQHAAEIWTDEYAGSDLGLEEHLFNTAFDCWLAGGPGQKGSYGCESLDEMYLRYFNSAKCLYILHEEGINWSPPICDWRNF